MKLHNRAYFYKYVTANVAKSILGDLLVKCSSPLIYDDPLDSRLEIQHDIKDSEELIERIVTGACNMFAEKLGHSIQDGSAKSVTNEIIKDKGFVCDKIKAFEKFYEDINQIVLEFAKKDRMFCVTEKNDNLLMWENYAQNHEGAVIKFKCIPEKQTGLCAAKKVRYSDDPIILTIEHFFQGQAAVLKYILDEILLTKQRKWEYEEEWRVILLRQSYAHDYDLRGILEEEVEAIYLGCHMAEEDKRDLTNLIVNSRENVRIYESIKGNSKVSFRSLD